MCVYTLKKSSSFNEFWIEYLEDFLIRITLSWKNLNDETYIFKIMWFFFFLNLVPDGIKKLMPEVLYSKGPPPKIQYVTVHACAMCVSGRVTFGILQTA